MPAECGEWEAARRRRREGRGRNEGQRGTVEARLGRKRRLPMARKVASDPGGHPAVFFGLYRLLRTHQDLSRAVIPDKLMVIEGFPRSGNSFSSVRPPLWPGTRRSA